MWRLIVLMALSGCDQLFEMPFISAGSATDAPSGWLPDYGYRKLVTISPTSDLADFMVNVLTAADPDLARHATLTGRDIVFTTADGVTVVESELVDYDPMTGALDSWARVPMLSAPRSSLYLSYGGPNVPDGGWPTAYAGVWHASGKGGLEADSTSHGHGVTATVAQIPRSDAGIVGSARNYDGTDDRMCKSTVTDQTLEPGTTSFSIAVWVNVPASKGLYDTPLYNGGGTAIEPGYSIELGLTTWTVSLADGTSLLTVSFGTEILGRWVYLAAVVDRGVPATVRTYVDGAPAESKTLSLGSLSGPEPFCLGGPYYFFAGILDEPRVYNVALSPAWIATEHANVVDRARFMTLGPEQAR